MNQVCSLIMQCFLSIPTGLALHSLAQDVTLDCMYQKDPGNSRWPQVQSNCLRWNKLWKNLIFGLFLRCPICPDLCLALCPLPSAFIYTVVGLLYSFQGYYHLLPFASLTALPKPPPCTPRAVAGEQDGSSPKG